MSFTKEKRISTLNGIFFVSLFALSSLYLASLPFLTHLGIGSLVIAILLGLFYSNTLRHGFPREWEGGLQFSAKKLLRLAIILYGFRISFQQMIAVGIEGFIIDCLVVIGTLLVGFWIGTKIFNLDRHLALLISVGSAICGAAAVLAAEDILKSEPYKATVAVATVVLFGTLSMFLYPFLQHAGFLHLSPNQFGIFAGASIHEVAQVVVAGNNISNEASNVAVIVKMTRVLLLVPVLLFFAWFFQPQSTTEKQNIPIPWFAFGFILMIGFNSLNLLPPSVVTLIQQVDVFLLTMAMAAIGIETNLSKIKKVGLKPLYLATLLFLWLFGLSYFLVQ